VQANAEQAERWNGPSGQYWIRHLDRHMAEHQNLTPHLFWAAGIMPGERVLDVGCGCGQTTIAAARTAHDGAGRGGALGLDLSAPMLDVARRLTCRDAVANVAFVQADAQAGPLRPGSCDVVISKFGVMFFADPGAAFAALAAATRARGRLAFLCWQDDSRNEVFGIISRAVGVHIPAAPAAPAGPAAGLFEDPGRITGLLSGCGWGHVQVTAVTEPAWIGSDLDDVMAYVRGMPRVRNLLASLDDPALAGRALATMAAQYAERQRPDGVWVRAAAWLVTASRAPGDGSLPQGGPSRAARSAGTP
jgi:SAM-dependent methyltransferase